MVIENFLTGSYSTTSYSMGLFETYLFSDHIYMPLFRNSDGRILDLTWENL